jgi:hypothetical protein
VRDAAGKVAAKLKIMHESSAYDLILEEGAIKSSHRHLLRLGQTRLGAPDEKTVVALKAIHDIDRLDA